MKEISKVHDWSDLAHEEEINTELICQCGNNSFYLAEGSYFSAAKCTKCGEAFVTRDE